jgi:hypothetical protein
MKPDRPPLPENPVYKPDSDIIQRCEESCFLSMGYNKSYPREKGTAGANPKTAVFEFILNKGVIRWRNY